MNWSEVRSSYPDQWVKLKILKSHNENDYLYIDDMEVIKATFSDQEATRELSKCKGDSIMFHTSHDTIKTKIIKSMGLFRRIPS